MLIRDLRIIEQEVHGEGERRLAQPLKRVAACAVVANPFAGTALTDHEALVARSVELGALLTARAMERIAPAAVTGYAKAALVGTGGDLEQGAAMIHVRVGRTMRAPLRRGYALIPGTCKIAAAGAPIDLNFGGIDDAWDYDAMDTMTIALPDASRPDEIVLIVAFSGPRPFARIRGASSETVKALVDDLRGAP
jgi:hypothetical protein